MGKNFTGIYLQVSFPENLDYFFLFSVFGFIEYSVLMNICNLMSFFKLDRIG